jgi:hypothetical protein
MEPRNELQSSQQRTREASANILLCLFRNGIICLPTAGMRPGTRFIYLKTDLKKSPLVRLEGYPLLKARS